MQFHSRCLALITSLCLLSSNALASDDPEDTDFLKHLERVMKTTLNPSRSRIGAGRPSTVAKLLQWDTETGNAFKDSARASLLGEEPPTTRLQRLGDQSVAFTRSAFSFYTASGILAAAALGLDYPNDPRAWTEWLEMAKDPVFYLSFGGFVMAASPFYQRMGPMDGPASKVLPWFSAGIIAGGITSKFLNDFLHDPNFRECYGFDNYRLSGKFKFQMQACDALYDHWANLRLDQELLPLIADLVMSPLAFYGSLRAVDWTLHRSQVEAALGSAVRVLKVPPSLVHAPKSPVAFAAYFLVMWGLSSKQIGLGQKIADWQFDYNVNLQLPLRASYDFLFHGLDGEGRLPSYTQEYGDSYQDSETKVLREWKRIAQSAWKNPFQYEVCINSSRNEQIFYDCAHPDKIDFDKALDRYAEKQKTLRHHLLLRSEASFRSWANKVYGYNKMIAAAYEFYKNYVTSSDNPASHAAVEKQVGSFVSFDFYSLLLPHYLTGAYKETWSHLLLNDASEFMIASMACGPEVEKFPQPSGVLSRVTNALFGSSSPKTMARESRWADVQFFPPRIVDPLPGGAVICDQPPGGLFTVDTFPYLEEGIGMRRGLNSYVTQHLRNSLNSDKAFDDWWSRFVLKPQNALEDQFRSEYIVMLKENFIPALRNSGYHWCDLSPPELRNSSLESQLRRFSQNEVCATYATHRQAEGVFNSLNDELRLYNAMLLDLFASVPRAYGFQWNQEEPQKTLLKTEALMLDMQTALSTLEAPHRESLDKLHEQFTEQMKTLKQSGESLLAAADNNWKRANARRLKGKTPTEQDQEWQIWQAETSHIPLILDLLRGHISNVFFESADNYKVLAAFEAKR